jgi:hypothetical protein
VTALLTVALWVLLFAVVWGPSLVLTGGALVAFVFAVSVPAALAWGLSLMFARRRLDGGPADEREPAL